ncbi:hypothetical protein CAEBREN_18910 [Caenorhabditis brenneri]|uniref:Sdz-33 F-box domain-containing protein n=1 Tax=Caenorhabditis brenneri TaxID=135651 RepID=G0P6C0_CAEBE|nr:hypothetical protein CAEBREN_18910 [Caenorhabditis brenneri]
MSLSRPVKFPILKLPFLCIEAVVKNWNVFDMISFALFSKRTRQIVKHLKIPLNRIRIFLSTSKEIELANSFRKWYFRNESKPGFLSAGHQKSRKNPLVLRMNGVSLYTSKTFNSLVSYTDGNEMAAVKMVMEFLNEVFKCSVERVDIYNDNYPESGDIGVKSTVDLSIDRHFGYARSQKLSLLLANLEVTGTCEFRMNSTEKDFFVNPKLFKCKKLLFWMGSDAWVTREILLQFEVPRLKFRECPFSVEDIAAFIAQWFQFDNKKLEYLYIPFRCRKFSLETFRTAELNPVPFRERNRAPS